MESEFDGKSSKISSSNLFAIASTSPGSSEHTKGESGKGNANFTKTIERLRGIPACKCGPNSSY